MFTHISHRVAITLALLLIWSTVVTAEQRTWTDITGKFSLDAEFVESRQDSVVLKKTTGEMVKVPIARLSKADQEYVQSLNDGGQARDHRLDAVEVITNSIGMKLALLPAGEFMMGRARWPESMSNALPDVALTQLKLENLSTRSRSHRRST